MRKSAATKKRSAMVRSSSASRSVSRRSLNDAANNYAVSTANYTRQTVTSALHQHAKRGDHVKQLRAAHATHSDPQLGHLHHLAAPDCSLCKPIPGNDRYARALLRSLPTANSSLDQRVKEVLRRNKLQSAKEDRPPFVVRRVDPVLITRSPGLEPTDANGDADFYPDASQRPRSALAKHRDLSRDRVEADDATYDDYCSRRSDCPSRYGSTSCLLCDSSRLSGTSSIAGDADDTDREAYRPHRPEREPDRGRTLSRSSSMRSLTSMSDLYLSGRNSSTEISDKVRQALLRDSAYEKRVVSLLSDYDLERRHRDSLQRLELDLLRSKR